MPNLTKSFHIVAKDFVHAGEASMEVQSTLKQIGFSPDLVRRVAICAYESEMNVVMHGGDGEFHFAVTPETIELSIRDNGPGIENIDLALQEGYSTAAPEYREMGFGAGMGLPNIRKNSDFLEITSTLGQGTHLLVRFNAGETA